VRSSRCRYFGRTISRFTRRAGGQIDLKGALFADALVHLGVLLHRFRHDLHDLGDGHVGKDLRRCWPRLPGLRAFVRDLLRAIQDRRLGRLDAAQRELPRADLELLALAAAKHLPLEPGQLGFERPDPLQEQRMFGNLLLGRQHVYHKARYVPEADRLPFVPGF
jgi:hypothetical protein